MVGRKIDLIPRATVLKGTTEFPVALPQTPPRSDKEGRSGMMWQHHPCQKCFHSKKKSLNSIEKSLIPSSGLICGMSARHRVGTGWGIWGVLCRAGLDDSLPGYSRISGTCPGRHRATSGTNLICLSRKSISPETLLIQQEKGRSTGRKEAALPRNQIPDTLR